MDQKWIHMLMMLVFYQALGVSSGVVVDVTPKEGGPVEITCSPTAPGSTVTTWFRVLDTSGVEFIGSFAPSSGTEKAKVSDRFDASKASQNKLILKSFNKNDGGIYTCASLKNNALHFGRLTRLVVEKKAPIATKAPAITTTKKDEAKTTTACVCNTSTKSGGSGFSTFCNPIILGALAGTCGLLLLLLIIISVYCSRIRTRRCPHHYKRKPRTPAPGKQMMANRHV